MSLLRSQEPVGTELLVEHVGLGRTVPAVVTEDQIVRHREEGRVGHRQSFSLDAYKVIGVDDSDEGPN